MPTDPPQRIPRVTPEEWTDETREVFTILSGPQFNMEQSRHHVISTYAQHPALAKPFLVFNRHLLATSTLPVRLRQIAIMRVAWLRRAVYMWSSHVRMSLGLGLGREDFEAIKQGPESPHWSAFESGLVRGVDQLCANSEMDDAVWDLLAEQFDHKQMLDLLFTIGAYMAQTFVFNAIRIQREPELVALAEEYGAP